MRHLENFSEANLARKFFEKPLFNQRNGKIPTSRQAPLEYTMVRAIGVQLVREIQRRQYAIILPEIPSSCLRVYTGLTFDFFQRFPWKWESRHSFEREYVNLSSFFFYDVHVVALAAFRSDSSYPQPQKLVFHTIKFGPHAMSRGSHGVVIVGKNALRSAEGVTPENPRQCDHFRKRPQPSDGPRHIL